LRLLDVSLRLFKLRSHFAHHFELGFLILLSQLRELRFLLIRKLEILIYARRQQLGCKSSERDRSAKSRPWPRGRPSLIRRKKHQRRGLNRHQSLLVTLQLFRRYGDDILRNGNCRLRNSSLRNNCL
jgi:hypothetical protein